MVIFNSYVKLPEGNNCESQKNLYQSYAIIFSPSTNWPSTKISIMNHQSFTLDHSLIHWILGMSKALRSNSRPLSRGQQAPVRRTEQR